MAEWCYPRKCEYDGGGNGLKGRVSVLPHKAEKERLALEVEKPNRRLVT